MFLSSPFLTKQSIMKFSNCYYLKFKSTGIQPIEFFKTISCQILDSGDDNYLTVENSKYDGEGYEFMFLFLEPYKTMQFIEKLLSINCVDEYMDVSELLINGELEHHPDFKLAYFGFPEQLEKFSYANSNSFIPDKRHLFDAFILKHRSIDVVLEKIQKYGVDNILTIDKQILQQHNN